MDAKGNIHAIEDGQPVPDGLVEVSRGTKEVLELYQPHLRGEVLDVLKRGDFTEQALLTFAIRVRMKQPVTEDIVTQRLANTLKLWWDRRQAMEAQVRKPQASTVKVRYDLQERLARQRKDKRRKSKVHAQRLAKHRRKKGK